MKVLYSELKTFIPKLKADPVKVGQALTLIGLMTDSVDAVVIDGKKDTLFDLEVRQNRPDYLGVWGIAKDLAVYLNLPFQKPKAGVREVAKAPKVVISAKTDIRRVVVASITGVNNTTPSPKWLKESLTAKGVNSVNLLVDLSNWAMLSTGLPNHFFDADKVEGGLHWQRALKREKLVTLDGTELQLGKGQELVIADTKGALVLASAVGGLRSAVSATTTNLLVEVASYNGTKMRKDARGLNVFTEASVRLEKNLSPVNVAEALDYALSLLVKFFPKAQISKRFEYYPSKITPKPIAFSVTNCSRLGGLEVRQVEAVSILKRLGCKLTKKNNDIFLVSPPSDREDLEQEADLIEEVLRMVGFNKIPSQRPRFTVVERVTSKRVLLEDALRHQAIAKGLDEILSSPLTTSEANSLTNIQGLAEVRTENAINEEMPVLRQSLVSGLLAQQKEYLLNGVEHVSLFEVGKVFSKTGQSVQETDRFAVLLHTSDNSQAFQNLQKLARSILGQVGAVGIEFIPAKKLPASAEIGMGFEVQTAGTSVGVAYKVAKRPLSGNRTVHGTAVLEVDIDLLVRAIEREVKVGQGQELLMKLVVLDVNVEIDPAQVTRVAELVRIVKKTAGKFLWAVEVADEFLVNPTKKRLTIRCSYQNLPDQEAKTLHDKVVFALG